MPSRKNATNLSEPLAFIQFSSYPPKWAFTNPPCFVQKLLASSSKYRDCKRKGGILVYSSESSRFGGKKIKLHATLPFGNAFSKLFVLCPSSHQSLTYAVSDLIDRLWQPKYLGSMQRYKKFVIRFDQSPSIKFKIYNSYDSEVWLCMQFFSGSKQLHTTAHIETDFWVLYFVLLRFFLPVLHRRFL